MRTFFFISWVVAAATVVALPAGAAEPAPRLTSVIAFEPSAAETGGSDRQAAKFCLTLLQGLALSADFDPSGPITSPGVAVVTPAEARRHLDRVRRSPGRPALLPALRRYAEIGVPIVIVCDGNIPDGAQVVRHLRGEKCLPPVFTVGIRPGAGERLLREIAKAGGGDYSDGEDVDGLLRLLKKVRLAQGCLAQGWWASSPKEVGAARLQNVTGRVIAVADGPLTLSGREITSRDEARFRFPAATIETARVDVVRADLGVEVANRGRVRLLLRNDIPALRPSFPARAPAGSTVTVRVPAGSAVNADALELSFQIIRPGQERDERLVPVGQFAQRRGCVEVDLCLPGPPGVARLEVVAALRKDGLTWEARTTAPLTIDKAERPPLEGRIAAVQPSRPAVTPKVAATPKPMPQPVDRLASPPAADDGRAAPPPELFLSGLGKPPAERNRDLATLPAATPQPPARADGPKEEVRGRWVLYLIGGLFVAVESALVAVWVREWWWPKREPGRGKKRAGRVCRA